MAAGALVSLNSGLDDPILLTQWLAIAWSTEIAPNQLLARQILNRDIVLWRDSTNTLHCWRDLCIHRGAKLSLGKVSNDCVICPYHAWQYDVSGQCIKIPAQPNLPPPAKAHAETYQTRERYGIVWVCLGTPSSDTPDFPQANDPTFRLVQAGPYRFRANGPRVMENLYDVAHLGIVHAGLLGDPLHPEIEDYEVTMSLLGPEAKAIRIWQPDPDGTGQPALVTYRYWAAGPLTAGLEKIHGPHNFGILSQVAPIDANHCELRMVIAMNYGHDIPAADIRAFQDTVTEQDRGIVESQRPELLPLDLQTELHLRSDRMAIAYRKWLRDIGFTYGTA
jgi:phenylpropionate dioxygenase-like ring-hydroxylating dioxygenase large terminal subunit